MNRTLKVSTALASIAGATATLYSLRALRLHNGSIGSRVAEDVIRIVNSGAEPLDQNRIDAKIKENRKEHKVADGLMNSEVEVFYKDGMKVFRVWPGKEKPARSMLYLHGGGYINQPSLFHWLFVDRMVQDSGMEFIVPIYPKTPEYTFKDAYQVVSDLYIDLAKAHPEGLALMGDSAGGGLALGLSQWLRSHGHPMPKLLILMSPWLDISVENPEVGVYQALDPMLSVTSLKDVGRAWSGGADPSDYRLSPMYGDLKDLPKIAMFAGTREVCLPDARKFASLLKEARVDFVYYEYPWMNHIFPLYPIKEGREARQQILALLETME
ncbi:alpha/beta hydrolase fold domain-containing protein [Salinicoccus sesuvii]|uniref:Alpha/beta hydrolase fold domain-containing protein n=1 Tax=Salinicoccus sesuvii TaxID=868281 RepID=A0ABV7N6V0_9STAP